MMVLRFWPLVAFVGGLVSAPAFPIGRIGNNTQISDPTEGYTTTMPTSFQSLSTVSDGGARLESGLFMGSPPQAVEIHMLSFRSQYPRLLASDRASIRRFFLDSTNIRYSELATGNGALNLFGEAERSYVGLSVCGDGRGYVVFGAKANLIEASMKEMIRQTHFERPCRN